MEPSDDTGAWHDAASGLDTHRAGVLIRLVVILIGVAYVVIQLESKSGGAEPGMFTMLLGVGELFAALFAIAGASRFARCAPRGTAAGATIATLSLVGVLIAECWILWVLWRVIQFTSQASHGGGMSSLDDLITAAERLPYVQIAAGIAALVAMLAVLAAIRSVGRALQRDDVVSRAGGMMVATVGLAGAYFFVERWIARGHDNNDAILVLAVLALYGLIVMFGYLGTLRLASDAMRARRQPAATLPTATIHQG